MLRLLEVCFESPSVGIFDYPDGSSELLWLPGATVKYLSVGHWVIGSNLRLNSAKCKTMIITRHRTRAVQVPELKLYGQALERVFEYKYLGVSLSYNLSWSPRMEKIVAKTRRLTGMLY